MNWRRGLLLSGIQLIVAAVSLVQVEAFTWHWIRSGAIARASPHVQLAVFQEEQMMSNPCDFGIWDIGYSPLSLVASAASLPVTLITGWHTPCNPNRSVFTRQVEAVFGRNTRRAEFVAVACLCLMVLVLWLFVGGMPLARTARWWLEPGAAITILTLLGLVLAFTRYTREFCRWTALAASIGWFWWLGLLFWRIGRLPWQSTLRGFRRLN